MKASEFIAEKLLSIDDPYGSKYRGKPRMLMSVRLPVEQIAWLKVLEHKGVGDTKTAVVQLLLDIALEQIGAMDELGDDLHDAVEAITERLIEEVNTSR
ncbi:hypothetical protein H0A65_09695 [Alcaligenaceae bacterium]|nr:hypothetical protein [Alcaligenaceae bacterium]